MVRTSRTTVVTSTARPIAETAEFSDVAIARNFIARANLPCRPVVAANFGQRFVRADHGA